MRAEPARPSRASFETRLRRPRGMRAVICAPVIDQLASWGLRALDICVRGPFGSELSARAAIDPFSERVNLSLPFWQENVGFPEGGLLSAGALDARQH